jgi:hypothetical protein
MKTVILCLLVAIALGYSVNWKCGACPPGVGNVCWIMDGGPISNFALPIDGSYPSCAATGLLYPIVIDFGCDSSCSGSGCGMSLTIAGQTQSTCSNTDGASLIAYLNVIYGASKGDPTLTYNWCGDVSCVSTGLIIGLVIGGVVLIGVIVGVVVYMRKKKAGANEGAYRPV